MKVATVICHQVISYECALRPCFNYRKFSNEISKAMHCLTNCRSNATSLAYSSVIQEKTTSRILANLHKYPIYMQMLLDAMKARCLASTYFIADNNSLQHVPLPTHS